jgi:hypothetical protein
MTSEDVITGLKNLRLFMELQDKMNKTDFNSFTYDCVDMAIESLEKQMPHKIFKHGHDYICPVCGYTINCCAYTIYHANYCEECGTKIDWSDEE